VDEQENSMKKLTGLILVVAVMLSISTQTAYACEPEEGTSTPLADRVRQAPIVLEGTIIGLDGHTRAVVRVDRYFKDNLTNHPAVVKISGFGSIAECLEEVELGEHRIFYAEATDTSGELVVDAGTTGVNPNRIEIILQVTGQEPILPDAPTNTPTMPTLPAAQLNDSISQESKNTAPLPLLLLLLLISLLSGIAAWRILLQRSTTR
jgi:hypothetical protein